MMCNVLTEMDGALSKPSPRPLTLPHLLQVQTLTVRLLMAPALCMKLLKMDTKISWSSSSFRKLMPTNLERLGYYRFTSLPKQEVTCRHTDCYCISTRELLRMTIFVELEEFKIH